MSTGIFPGILVWSKWRFIGQNNKKYMVYKDKSNFLACIFILKSLTIVGSISVPYFWESTSKHELRIISLQFCLSLLNM